MDVNIDVKNIHKLKYQDLRKIAKTLGIPAKGKSEKLAKAIQEHYSTSQHQTVSTPECRVMPSESTDNSLKKNVKPVSPATKKPVKKSITPKASSSSKSSLSISDSKNKPSQRRSSLENKLAHHRRLASSRTAYNKRRLSAGRSTTPKQSIARRDAVTTPGKVSTPRNIPTRNVTTPRNLPTRNVTTPHNLPTRNATTPSNIPTPQRTATAHKTATPRRTSMSRRTSTSRRTFTPPPKKDDPTPGKRKRSNTPNGSTGGNKKHQRSGTYEVECPSPAVSLLLDSMKPGMSDEERREGLLRALDQTAALAVASDKDESSGKETEPSTDSDETPAPTHIPRYTGLQRPKTPGSEVKKNWSRIHQRTFSKMPGLEEYLARKRERTAKLSASLRVIQDRARGLEGKLDYLHKMGQRGSRSKLPLAVPPSPAPVKSAVTPFKPAVAPAAKMNFNFTGGSDKVVFKASTKPDVTKANTRATNTVSSAKKEKENKCGTCCCETHECDRSDSKQKANKFNLQSSLQRKLNYTPHKGQLKPFVFGASGSKASPAAKSFNDRTRQARRYEAKSRQARHRNQSQMDRRGITN